MDNIVLGLVVVLAALLIGMLQGRLIFFRISKKFYAGKYKTARKLAEKEYNKIGKNIEGIVPLQQQEKIREFLASVLVVSCFSLKDYEQFLFYNQSMKKEKEFADFWISVYKLVVLKDVSGAEEFYLRVKGSDNSTKLSSESFALMDALFLYEKGMKEEAYPKLKKVHEKLKMLALRQIADEYLEKYSSQTE